MLACGDSTRITEPTGIELEFMILDKKMSALQCVTNWPQQNALCFSRILYQFYLRTI